MEKNRFWSMLLCAALLLTLTPAAALALGSPVDYIDANGEPANTGSTPVSIITGSTSALSSGWYVVSGDVSRTGTITVNGDAHLIIEDGASLTVTGSIWNAGINVSGSKSLTIYGQSEGTGLITATGDAFGAGIGGGENGSAGRITINGGTVSATGGIYGAGIGGGYHGGGAQTNINGGTVSATGSIYGAGIGGGYDGNGGMTTINGGMVTATGNNMGAGIGGGYDGGGGTTTICGGTVAAMSNNLGAGIGGGYDGNGGTVTISGGTVTATGNTLGAGIGGGDGGSGGTTTISGGTVTATGGYLSAGIGGGYDGSGGTTIISGGTVKTSSIQASPTNGAENGSMPVYLTTVTLFGLNTETEVASLASSATYYGTKDIKTDAEGKLYLYLPLNSQTTGATTASSRYGDNTVTTAASGSQGTLYPPAFTVTGDSAGYTYGDDGLLTFTGAGAYEVSMFIPGFTTITDKIIVLPGVISDITLSGVKIDLSQTGGCAFDVTGAAVNLTLAGENSLISGGANAGLHCPDGATLTIGGAGVLTATGGSSGGAGIGSIGGESCGRIDINSGAVYASGGDGAQDVGSGTDGSDGELALSGTAQVFLKNDSSIEPVTSTHTRKTFTEDTDEVYGIPVPSAWAPPLGAYLRLCTLSYDANNGSGTVPEPITGLYNSTETIAEGSGLTRAGYKFAGWNTEVNGGGMTYAPGEPFIFTADTVLYVQWATEVYTVSYHPNDGIGAAPMDITRYYVGDKVLLKPGSGLVRAGYVFAGWSLTPDGAPLGDPYTMGYHDVTLFAVWQSEEVGTPPKTGDDASIFGLVMIAAALAAAWVTVSRKRVKD